MKIINEKQMMKLMEIEVEKHSGYILGYFVKKNVSTAVGLRTLASILLLSLSMLDIEDIRSASVALKKDIDNIIKNKEHNEQNEDK